MNLKTLEIFRFKLGLNENINELLNEVLTLVNATAGNDIIYLKLTIAVRDKLLDVIRLVTSKSKLYEHLYYKVGSPHIIGLLKELIKLDPYLTELRLVITPLSKEILTNTFLGDFYIKDLITPSSHALTYFKIGDLMDNIIFEDTPFNICSVTNSYKVVGCLIKSSPELLSYDLLQSLINAIVSEIKELNPMQRYITWLLTNSNSVYVIDY
ncbi:MAG: hypothetical protein QXO98_04150 [Sulfolobales archaeon]